MSQRKDRMSFLKTIKWGKQIKYEVRSDSGEFLKRSWT